ncbi:hypothetical protein EYC84_008952 [Monilinia fructicola]|uniref:Histone H2B n=1 Tax=Monilinia fructicola TaxID=38448 RepID=A0A5M9JCB9_MONFR|nr:hypothetical protein EYC84_008952 [Monilinia fructicola]
MYPEGEGNTTYDWAFLVEPAFPPADFPPLDEFWFVLIFFKGQIWRMLCRKLWLAVLLLKFLFPSIQFSTSKLLTTQLNKIRPSPHLRLPPTTFDLPRKLTPFSIQTTFKFQNATKGSRKQGTSCYQGTCLLPVHDAPASASKVPAKQDAGKKTTTGEGKPRKKKGRKETYSSYIYKVLKQVHPDTGISNRAMSILNSFVNDIFERVATEASKLAAYNKKSTISSREIQTSYVPAQPHNSFLLTVIQWYQGCHQVLFIHEISCLFFGVLGGYRICLSSGVIYQMMPVVVREPWGFLFNALWMVCFLWGQMSSRSVFGKTKFKHELNSPSPFSLIKCDRCVLVYSEIFTEPEIDWLFNNFECTVIQFIINPT